jgi:anti-sigma factor RsiW
MSTPPPDLETLMAYADDALPADEAARIAQYLVTDAQARAQVAQFRRSASLASQAFAADLDRPLPPALRAAVDQAIARQRAQRRDAVDAVAPPAAATDTAASASPIRPSRPSRPEAPVNPVARLLDWLGLTSGPRFGFAAAGVTLLAGLVGFVIGHSAPGPQVLVSSAPMGLLVASAAEQAEISRLLDTVPSGQRRALGQGAELEFVASFRDGAGTLCREFNLQRTNEAALAVACRQGERWAVTFASAAPPGGSYAPAASPSAALDAYVAAIGGGAALPAADEARALASR